MRFSPWVALRVLEGSSTVGDLAIFGAAAARLRSTLEGLINVTANLLEQMLNISDLRELLAAESRNVPALRTAAPQYYRGEIELDWRFLYLRWLQGTGSE